jgi:AraC family transcriptional regulator
MKRVLNYIDRHLEDDLGLDTLSAVAALSKYHFHRQFRGHFGLSVHRYVQLARMKRAGQVLAFKDEASVTETALDVGYDAPDAFARAFRKSVGQLPSAFRDTPDWEVWFARLRPLTSARSKLMKTAFSLGDVNIVDVPETPVAVLQHRGNPARVAETIQKFIAWRRAAGLSAASSATYNVFHSDSDTTPPDEFRLDICAATDRKIEPNDEGVEAGVLPAGRCAVLRVIGAENVEPAIEFLYRDWLPASGEDLRDFPLYCQRVSFVPMVPEHEAITDIFLPLV